VKKKKKSLFVVFEGIDGSGKTTLSKLLFSYLKKQHYHVQWFNEPSNSKWGKKIREIANSVESIPIEEELQYFIEDRKLDVQYNILPGLNQNKIVILDRYFYSNACYQGARGLDMQDIINKNLEFSPLPDITFIIDVDVDTALSRIKESRDTEAILFEKKEFLLKVRENYLTLKKDNIHIIDGNNEVKAVFSKIKALMPL
jgi:dTMP kinase